MFVVVPPLPLDPMLNVTVFVELPVTVTVAVTCPEMKPYTANWTVQSPPEGTML